jgi:hypothetical protein
LVLEDKNESTGFSEKDLSQLQDRSPQASAVCDLYGQKAQAKTRLNNGQQ